MHRDMTDKRIFQFSQWLIEKNPHAITHFQEWLFYPGMLFGAQESWWGAGKKRPRPHEGLDMCFYRDREGVIHHWGRMVVIPLMEDGVVQKISTDDFIGCSIYVIHPHLETPSGEALYSIYAHVTPIEKLHEGDRLRAGTLIAHVADFKKTKAAMIDHFHFSLALLPFSFLKKNMNWKTMADPAMVTLLNPLDHMACRYGVRAYEEKEKQRSS